MQYIRKYILFFIIISAEIVVGFTQEKRDTYLFPEFKEAFVYYKDGRVFQVPINYNLIIGKFLFIDKDKQKKEFSDPEMVVSVKIDDKVFLPTSDGGAAEVIQFDPKIMVQYRGTVRKKKQMTYGGETETASVETFSHLLSGTGASALDTENIVLVGVDYDFYIESNTKMKRFSSEKQFLKIFPKRKAQLKQYINENKINFKDIAQVVQLCKYALAETE